MGCKPGGQAVVHRTASGQLRKGIARRPERPRRFATSARAAFLVPEARAVRTYPPARLRECRRCAPAAAALALDFDFLAIGFREYQHVAARAAEHQFGVFCEGDDLMLGTSVAGSRHPVHPLAAGSDAIIARRRAAAK